MINVTKSSLHYETVEKKIADEWETLWQINHLVRMKRLCRGVCALCMLVHITNTQSTGGNTAPLT